MVSWDHRREEMFICLTEQGYALIFMDDIAIDLGDWVIVNEILREEGCRI